MNQPVTYLPAYVGLYAALLLAVTCNAYLDIQYGSFAIEVAGWAMVYLVTLATAWQQRGQFTDRGRTMQERWLAAALLVSLGYFMPTWGMPRAGLYALAAMQASLNCITVDRKRFMTGLMVSAVMVMFAATHYRADWTMLFYLLPYLVAVVFTLVAEQVSRRVQEVHEDGAAAHQGAVGGQGASIIASTLALVFIAALLYALTPHLTWQEFRWRYGQLSEFVSPDSSKGHGAGGTEQAGGAGNAGENADTAGGGNGSAPGGDQDLANGNTDSQSGDGYREDAQPRSSWPSVKEMRVAAARKGMPAWQANAIRKVAEWRERASTIAQPIQVQVAAATKATTQQIEAHRASLLRLLAGVLLMAFLVACYVFLRELRPGRWLRVKWDMLLLGQLGWHRPGNAGAIQFFDATRRLFGLHHVECSDQLNAREYLANLAAMHDDLRHEVSELVGLFEKARYSAQGVVMADVARMRQLYRACCSAL